ncbi:cobalt-precorrin-5B (C(1))-methyltransferase [Metabacillus fastidiosus]|uniref:cobalt-precorrin-5B (C(1))-methyltransferase n=1 Tax=Metabacillus fastidiosus TaxID=1458 RepID=UPI0008266885|nr:cobalt-precorrin-5B (C(1))-methyltransferase [Metabacillus fastidiosus]MED4454698.1 cobalt-precorrin-5B (C(1))-methyltransferase [Metabacillus fastidiosus]MED4460889.1 cobalt-precorrin-5B (C(1))-methyltransferase [Metabacillus fastidiosus]
MEKKVKKDPSEMRHGYTTGACATAVTKAALIALITGEEQENATIHLPIGRDATFTIEKCAITKDTASCETIKDAGDDPDATHQALIISTVSFVDSPGIVLDGGVGVGRVTKPGLPVPVGEAAINPVPRKMIITTVQETLEEFQINRGVKVVISVPEGEEMAKKTLNGRLGIIGGISILGTRGTVVPFSSSAYMASIVQAISVAKASGCDHLVLTTGGRSEKYGMALLPDLPEEAFIEMGDFVGFSLKQCKKQEIKKVTLVGMMGKFSKVAQGVMMVHSKSAPIDFGFLAEIARSVGASEELAVEIENANTASQVGDMMLEANHDEFFNKLCVACCHSALKEVKGGIKMETAIYTLKGQLLGRAVGIESID